MSIEWPHLGALQLIVRFYLYSLRIWQKILPFGMPPPAFLRRGVWKPFYSMVCRVFVSKEVVSFLNMGYVGDPSELVGIDPDDLVDCMSMQLYEQVVRGVDLTGLKMVEVGCGPGAGSEYLARRHRPASLVGVDLNGDLIEWGRGHHRLDNLEFRQGDAQKLPIDDNSVDSVVNVESSHCYPSRLHFFREVIRVLCPGGVFLFADITFVRRGGSEADVISAQLTEAGLEIEDRIDITQNVLAARYAASASSSFRARIREKMTPAVVALAEEGFGMHGSMFYDEMAAGRVRYTQWRASKPVEGSAIALSRDPHQVSS